jgi:hypothetical protein
MPLNPVFDRNPVEGMLIGRMLLNYGEIELLVAMLLGNAIEEQNTALRMMFRIIGESSRIAAADALMRKAYKTRELEPEYADAIGAVRWCVKVRNQYAHCHWGDDPGTEGVFFTELGEPAKASEGFEYWFRHVDYALLAEQIAYFDYAGDCLSYVNFEYITRQGKIPGHTALMPSKRAPPSLHNPPALHIPQWLSPEQRQRHTERAQAEEAAARPQPDKPKRMRKPSSRERREVAAKAKPR